MAHQPLVMSPNYRAFVRGIRALHRLALSGKDESPEADTVRDAMDVPWEALSDIERKRARGLSGDLYSISDPPDSRQQEMNAQAQDKLTNAIEARQRGEWDRALELLRRLDDDVDPALLSFLRGSIWLYAGDPETALLFVAHALRLQPDNGKYLAMFLHTLNMVDPGAARERARQILEKPEKTSPVAVAWAADIVFRVNRSLPDAEALGAIGQLVPALQWAFSRIEAGDEAGIDHSSYMMTVLLLAFCHELLGKTQAAVDYLTKGLQVDPYNDALLGARGALLYGATPRAITDLEVAIQNGSQEIWPYFFLAHHYLMTGRFDECRAMCERASHLPASAAVRSELAEWVAISEAEQAFPAEKVRASFEIAIRLDPANEWARRNLAAFEAALALPGKSKWQMRSESALRASAQAERQYPVAA
jgi:tetratricopeptide (TPR) repeat protein